MTFNIANPHFASPEWLSVTLVAPLLLVCLEIYASRARRREMARLASPKSLDAMLVSHSPMRRRIKHALKALMLAGVGLALARPQWGEQTERSESLGEDVVFLLDCSLSMTAADVNPNRLTRAKLAIQEFVQQFGHGRVGLVAFAGQAFLQCPLTFDYDAFRDALQAVDERAIPVPGTDVGRALDEGYSAVEKNERRKILVLVSDGEDLEKSGVARARELAGKNVVIFTVGVGTPSGGELFITGPSGAREQVRTEQGQAVQSRLDEPVLRAIAEATHGSYQPLGAMGDGLELVRKALEGGLGFSRFVATRHESLDRFYVPAALVLILMVVDSLLGVRRVDRKYPVARRSAAMAHAIGLLVFGCALMAQAAGFEPDLPRSPRALFNLGTQRLRESRWREAEVALDAAIECNDASTQPLALYNLGQVLFLAGQETMKDVPTSATLEARSEQGIQSADVAIKSSDAALAGSELKPAAAAYRLGQSTIKSLKKTLDAIKGGTDACGNVLPRWQRAADNFESALELRPAYDNARVNAGFMAQRIVELTREQWKMQELREAIAAKKAELQKRLDALKRRLPPEETKGEHGADDDKSKDPSQSSKPDDRENKGDSGKELVLTPEEAMRLLSSLRLDLSRQYSAGNLPNDRQNRAGRTW